MQHSLISRFTQSLPTVVRFVVVGVLNTGFSYLIYALGLWAGLPYALANLLACVLGIFFSFRTQGALVFGDADNPKLWRFFLVWIAIYLVNILLIKFIISLGLNAYGAGALALPFIVVLSYLLQRLVVFRPLTS